MNDYNGLNLTQRADDAFFEMETNPKFKDNGEACKLIRQEVKKRISEFSSYLKRYLNDREGLSWDDEQPLDFYLKLIVYEFQSRGVPVSFDPKSSTSPKAAIRNWLTRRTVSRKTVFLLGFGLQMKPEDVNVLLTKGICEQGINPKDPFEVICWYCFSFGKNFSFYEALMQKYEQLPSKPFKDSSFSIDATMSARSRMYEINSPVDLFEHLSALKTSNNIPRISRTATKYFNETYDEISKIIAEEEGIRQDEVTDEMLQDFLYEPGIGKTEQNNLLPENVSDLHEVFFAKRLNRQRIGKLRSGKEQVTRYDLITMNFAIYAQKSYDRNIKRYNDFLTNTSEMLEASGFQEITIQNPYEFFILACIRTADPMGTFWDVWEQSIYADETW